MKEIAGIKLKNVGRKPEESKGGDVPVAANAKIEPPKITYPTIRCDTSSGGWSLPISLEKFKAGDKAILVALVNVKEKTKRESESEDQKEESAVTGELEFLKVGIEKSEGEEEPRLSGDEAESKLDDLMSKMKDEE
jgi:hypothetical protein